MTQIGREEPVRTLVVGLGATGVSCARFLFARGVQVAVTDSRERPPGLEYMQRELPQVPLFLGGFAPEAFEHAGRILVSPGVSLREPLIGEARARGAEVIGDIELFARHAAAPVIGITGSNGKSTVTSLLGEMAREAGRRVQVGGNLGMPALDLLLAEAELYVLELSSFQLETVHSLSCQAAVVLNLSPDHLDRHDSLADYGAAKQTIYRHARLQVVNRDDAAAAALAHAQAPVRGFTLDEPSGADFGVRRSGGEEYIARGDELLMPARALRMPGRHNLSNALAALALGEAAGLPMDSMCCVLRRFRGLPHRMQWVAECGGVRWYNDSKATNVGAMLAAVQGLSGPLVLILGGQSKGADFSMLARQLPERVRHLVLLGEAAEELEPILSLRFTLDRARDMAGAVRAAAAAAQPGDAVLLSPACASFDQFEDYAARGEAFERAVRELCA